MFMSKTVLITGASGGIGREIVEKFANEGYNIVYHYNNFMDEKIIAEVSAKTNILPIKADFRNREEIVFLYNNAKSAFGHIDVLVNNAGIDRVCSIVDEDISKIEELVQINLTAQILLTSLISKGMCENHKGSIINVSSIWGVKGGAMESVYSATKSGMIGFTKALSQELGLSGVRVNAVAPGLIDTKMNDNLTNNEKEEFISTTALNRIGKPKEVAELIYFLASDNSAYITGQVIGIDGGI